MLSEHGCPIAPSTYYDNRDRPPSRRRVRDAELIALIETDRSQSRFVAGLGARKMWLRLRSQGHDVARCTVERPPCRSREGAAPHRTNDLDGGMRRRTLQGVETAHLTSEGSRNGPRSDAAKGANEQSKRWTTDSSTVHLIPRCVSRIDRAALGMERHRDCCLGLVRGCAAKQVSDQPFLRLH